MRTTEHGIESSRDVEDLHHLRLMALLQELVREKRYRGAAQVLEIDPQTVSAVANAGQDVDVHGAVRAGGKGRDERRAVGKTGSRVNPLPSPRMYQGGYGVINVYRDME